MAKTKVLLCVSGSVAGVKVYDLVDLLLKCCYEVRVALTEHSRVFVDVQKISDRVGKVYGDQEEWSNWSKVGDDVLHIELRRWADVLVIAPLSANTMAKVANGLCDNLVTCVARAWPVGDLSKPFIVAPAMNTLMWDHPITRRQMHVLGNDLRLTVVPPVVKTLACGDRGMGAMASVEDVANAVADL